MKKILYLITLLCVIFLINWWMFNKYPGLFEILDSKFSSAMMYMNYDDSQVAAAKEHKLDGDKICIIELDEESYGEIDNVYKKYSSLSSRKRLAFAKIVDFLSLHKPKLILFDFTFEYDSDPYSDKVFFDSLAKAEKNGIKIILGSKVNYIDNFKEQRVELVKSVTDKFENAILNQDFKSGMVRETMIGIKKDDDFYKSLAFSGFLAYNDIEDYSFNDDVLVAGDYEIPVIKQKSLGNSFNYTFNLFYKRTWEQTTSYPVSAFINDELLKDYEESFKRLTYEDGKEKIESVFKNAVILVGTSAADDQDLISYPFSDFITKESVVPGVHVHLNSIYGLINGYYFQKLGGNNNFYITCLIFIFLSLVFYKLGPVQNILLLFVSVFVYIVGVSIMFIMKMYFIPPSFTVISLIISFIGVQSYKFFFESREKRQIRGAFSKYISPDLVNSIVKRPEMLKLGGEEKELTILFSDVANFTALSEKIGAVNLVSFLNEYLSAMTDIIMETRGTLDKYIGDAVMAFWGAPVDDEKHSFNACDAALKMMKKLNELKVDWKKKGYPDLNIRIGLNTGVVVVGNMGAANRFNYTVMGDAVNLASRLEGLNKQYGTLMMVSEFTYEKEKNNFDFRELDIVKVKGKNEPVRVYELLTFKPDENYKKGVEIYMQGLEKYRNGDFSEALDIFKKVCDIIPDETISKTYIQRCETLIKDAPEDWDGVWTMKTK